LTMSGGERVMTVQWWEFTFTGATFLVLTAYHLFWLYQVKVDPLKTYLGITKHLRRMWVQSIMKDKRDILAVQTMRNWIMASSFLASTAIIIGLGLLSLLFKPEHVTELPFDLTLIFSRMKTLFLVKVMVLVLHFFFAFFSFTLAIRYFNHTNLMINVPLECDTMLNTAYVANILNLGNLHYTLGMRAYYLAAVVTLWLFGPEYMLLGAIILTIIMYKQDHCCAEDYVGECPIPPEWEV
jgi:uncharacterized membrane protein